MNMRNPIDYIRYQLNALCLESVDLPAVGYGEFSKAPSKYLGNNKESVKLYGKDFMGFLIMTPHGAVTVTALYDSPSGTLTIAASPAADLAYDLADYRWGIEHIHKLFERLTAATMPKGVYEFMGEFQDLGAAF